MEQPNLSLAKKLFEGRFFSNNKLSNHKLVNIISINDEELTCDVVLQAYNITKQGHASTGDHLIFNATISIDCFKEMY